MTEDTPVYNENSTLTLPDGRTYSAKALVSIYKDRILSKNRRVLCVPLRGAHEFLDSHLWGVIIHRVGPTTVITLKKLLTDDHEWFASITPVYQESTLEYRRFVRVCFKEACLQAMRAPEAIRGKDNKQARSVNNDLDGLTPNLPHCIWLVYHLEMQTGMVSHHENGTRYDTYTLHNPEAVKREADVLAHTSSNIVLARRARAILYEIRKDHTPLTLAGLYEHVKHGYIQAGVLGYSNHSYYMAHLAQTEQEKFTRSSSVSTQINLPKTVYACDALVDPDEIITELHRAILEMERLKDFLARTKDRRPPEGSFSTAEDLVKIIVTMIGENFMNYVNDKNGEVKNLALVFAEGYPMQKVLDMIDKIAGWPTLEYQPS
jgi:hypothetical protein